MLFKVSDFAKTVNSVNQRKASALVPVYMELPGIIYRPYSAFAARRQRMIRIRYGL